MALEFFEKNLHKFHCKNLIYSNSGRLQQFFLLLLTCSCMFLIPNKSKQLELQLEKVIGVQKHAEKVRKINCEYRRYFSATGHLKVGQLTTFSLSKNRSKQCCSFLLYVRWWALRYLHTNVCKSKISIPCIEIGLQTYAQPILWKQRPAATTLHPKNDRNCSLFKHLYLSYHLI